MRFIALILLLLPITSHAQGYVNQFSFDYNTTAPTYAVHMDSVTGVTCTDDNGAIVLSGFNSTSNSEEASCEFSSVGLVSGDYTVDMSLEGTGNCGICVGTGNTCRGTEIRPNFPQSRQDFTLTATQNLTSQFGVIMEYGNSPGCSNVGYTIHSITDPNGSIVYSSTPVPDPDPTTLGLPSFITDQFSSGGSSVEIEVPDYTIYFQLFAILSLIFLFVYFMLLFKNLVKELL